MIPSADGLGIAQADRQTLEGESGKGAAAGIAKTRSGKVARDQHPLAARLRDGGLVVEDKVDLDDLAMVIAGAVAGGPQRPFAGLPSSKLDQEQRLPPDVFPKMVGRRHDGTAAFSDRQFD